MALKIDPETLLPRGYSDSITVETQISLSFWERVSLLFGRRLVVETRTYCQFQVGAAVTEVQRVWSYHPWAKPKLGVATDQPH